MPTAEARIQTERPGRYLTQICKHLSNEGRHLGHRPRAHAGGDIQATHPATEAQVEWSATSGLVRLGWGQATLQATAGTLTLQARAADEENLRRIQDLLTSHLDRFSRRDPLTVTWQPAPDASEA